MIAVGRSILGRSSVTPLGEDVRMGRPQDRLLSAVFQRFHRRSTGTGLANKKPVAFILDLPHNSSLASGVHFRGITQLCIFKLGVQYSHFW
jgi:hypothetical protein